MKPSALARQFRIGVPLDQGMLDRYEAYCSWCEALRIVPGPYEIWARELARLSEY